LAQILGISTSSTKNLLEIVGAKKIASRWVSHELKPEQKELRVNISSEHLQRYDTNPDILKRIIAIDKTWLKSYDPRDAKSLRQWVLPSQAP
jgi:hypothetical protein